MTPGIDYSLGMSNRDTDTGIHFGVIPMNDLNEWAYESFEPYYGEPTCPKCGNEAVDSESPIPTSVLEDKGYMELDADGMPSFDGDRQDLDYTIRTGCCGDYACDYCGILFDGDSAFGDEPLGHNLDDGEYKATLDSYNDVFIIKSPYFTYAGYCSPCAPGAGYLPDFAEQNGEPLNKGQAEQQGFPRVYCFGHDWFDDGKAPYLVYSVETGELVGNRKEAT